MNKEQLLEKCLKDLDCIVDEFADSIGEAKDDIITRFIKPGISTITQIEVMNPLTGKKSKLKDVSENTFNELKNSKFVNDIFNELDSNKKDVERNIAIIMKKINKTGEKETLRPKTRGNFPKRSSVHNSRVYSFSSQIRQVIFANPKTIVLWKDGSKTIVTAQGERFDKEKGVLMAYYKKLQGANYMKELDNVISSALVAKGKRRVKSSKPESAKPKKAVKKTIKKTAKKKDE